MSRGTADRFPVRASLCTLTLAVMAPFMFLVQGCSSSSPRYRASNIEDNLQEDDESRFASKIKTEEMLEDDRKVDLNEIKAGVVPGGQLPFRYKNLAPAGLNRDRMLLSVVSYLGAPYVYGGSSKQGIDCSGFTSVVYGSAADKQLPRSASDQYGVGRGIPRDGLQFGDLVFFNTTGRGPSHVGIYIEDDLFAHVSLTQGVTISSLESTYYRRRFVGARRLIE